MTGGKIRKKKAGIKPRSYGYGHRKDLSLRIT